MLELKALLLEFIDMPDLQLLFKSLLISSSHVIVYLILCLEDVGLVSPSCIIHLLHGGHRLLHYLHKLFVLLLIVPVHIDVVLQHVLYFLLLLKRTSNLLNKHLIFGALGLVRLLQKLLIESGESIANVRDHRNLLLLSR